MSARFVCTFSTLGLTVVQHISHVRCPLSVVLRSVSLYYSLHQYTHTHTYKCNLVCESECTCVRPFLCIFALTVCPSLCLSIAPFLRLSVCLSVHVADAKNPIPSPCLLFTLLSTLLALPWPHILLLSLLLSLLTFRFSYFFFVLLPVPWLSVALSICPPVCLSDSLPVCLSAFLSLSSV